MSEVVAQFENLGYAYHPGTWVMRRCSATVERGHIFAILGPNGRGKSTLLKLLLGLLQPTEGSLRLSGVAAFVPQLFQMSFDYTVLDVVLMGRARSMGLFAMPGRRDRELAFASLERVGLQSSASRPFHELSGGQRQLAIIARALASESDMLILDEPVSALDFRNQAIVLEQLSRLARDEGMTVIFTTHQPQHALSLADRCLLMMDTERFQTGPSSEVITEENLMQLYHVPFARVALQHQGRTMHLIAPVPFDRQAMNA